MNRKEVHIEQIGTVTVRKEAVEQIKGICFVLPGDVVSLLGTLVTIDDVSPVGDPHNPEAYTLTVSRAL